MTTNDGQESVSGKGNKPELPCAWCLQELGHSMENGSHGICKRHADIEFGKWLLAKARKVNKQHGKRS
jgi:hypothetical protein